MSQFLVEKPTGHKNFSGQRAASALFLIKFWRWWALLTWAALAPPSAIAADLTTYWLQSPSVLAPQTVFNWRYLYFVASSNGHWSEAGDALRNVRILSPRPIGAGGRGGFDLRDPFESGREVAAKGSINRSGFGGLASVAIKTPPLSSADFARGLQRLGADRLRRQTGLESISEGVGGKSLADIGAIVEGVNDQPATDQASDPGFSGAIGGPIENAAFAEQQSRRARDGSDGTSAGQGVRIATVADVASLARTANSSSRPRAFDASEGTLLDPLLNTTYDLTHPKVVPALK
jgi:hypothetical protein